MDQSRAWRGGPPGCVPVTRSRTEGDPALLWRAAEGLGISANAAAPAEADRLFTVATRVTFRHPLVRSAVYRAAPTVAAPTMPSPRPPILAPILTGGPGPRPQLGPTRTSPPSSSDRPAGRRRAAGSRRRPPS